MTDDLTIALESPRLILYAFHLRNSLDQSTQTVTATAAALWDSVVTLGEKLGCDELRQLRNALKCYQQDEYHQWHYQPTQEGTTEQNYSPLLRGDPLEFTYKSSLNGEFNAVRIHDTYIADLRWFTNDTLSVAELARLNPQGVMFPAPLTASLGQTLILFAKPTAPCDNYATLATACVTALFRSAMPLPKLTATAQLFGGPLFEFTSETDHLHLLVWFKTQEQTQTFSQTHSTDLLNLLSSRHKLYYVNSLARQSYRIARELYSQLEKAVKTFEDLGTSTETNQRTGRLDHLVTEATYLAVQYAHHLRNIQDHHNTLEVNTINYDTILQKIQTHYLDGDSLGLFQQFLTQSRLWQKQLQVHLTYLNNTGHLFDRTINSARSMIEIDTLKQLQQTEEKTSERQHDLEILVASVASLLEGAVLSAKVGHFLHSPEKSDSLYQTLGYHFLEIALHLGVGLIVAVGIVFLVKKWLKSKSH